MIFVHLFLATLLMTTLWSSRVLCQEGAESQETLEEKGSSDDAASSQSSLENAAGEEKPVIGVETTTAPSLKTESSTAEVTKASKYETDTLNREIQTLKAEMESMKKEYREKIERLEQSHGERLDDIELMDIENERVGEANRRYDFYGFYDFTAMWRHVQDGSFVTKDEVNTKLQFLIQNLNLYFTSQMTESLSFLSEIQFTFMPNGVTISDDDDGWSRVDTTAVNPYSQNALRLGGVVIQRVWLQWAPTQIINLKVGYYLTPYGIWHVDHGSPVRLSILPPFENNTVTPTKMKGRKPLPDQQLGVMLFGRAFPFRDISLDYALSVSNGRGPADTVIDYDDNKGVGLRLKLSYQRPNIEATIGAYGYFGEYTDLEGGGMPGATDAQEVTENFMEYVVSTDLLLLVYGVRFQVEHITNLVRYGDEGRPQELMGDGTTYRPDFVGNYVYGLIGYQLPLDRWLDGMTLTPFIGLEFDRPRDDLDAFRNQVLWFGVNFKPSAYIAIKIEGSRNHMEAPGRVGGGDFQPNTMPEDAVEGMDFPEGEMKTGQDMSSSSSREANVWTIAGQLAVSF